MPKKQTNKRSSATRSRVRRHVKLALVPHRANQYRPHAIRRYGVVAILVFVVAIQAIYNTATSGAVLGAQTDITTSGLLDATNAERAKQHESPLVVNAKLMEAAKLKVQNMFAEQYWDHTAPDGTTPWHWFDQAGYTYAEAGENLAKNFTSSTGTVAAWMASPTHRANILKSDYQDVGFAVMQGTLGGKPTTLVVALYGTPETAAVQGVSSTRIAPVTGAAIAPLDHLAIGIQSLTPAAVASIVVLGLAACLAIVAHAYRQKLPEHLRRSWYRHHGIYKAIGFTSLLLMVILAYGNIGQV